LNTIATVAERLDLVDRLSLPDVAKALWHHYEPLVVYLMLTCFDRLGQPADWIDFGAWLDAKHSAQGREGSVADVSSMDTLTALRTLYRRWLDLYGVRTSFYRFLRDVLPSGVHAALLESIHIHRLAVPPDIRRLDVDDRAKEDWLMGLRNAYTHKAQFVPGIPRDAFFTEMLSPETWTGMRQQRIEGEEWRSVDLRGWPEIPVITVRAGLVSYLTALAADAA
jgi:hypothetical protein